MLRVLTEVSATGINAGGGGGATGTFVACEGA